MEILYRLSELLYEDACEDVHGEEFHNLIRLEGKLMEDVKTAAGEVLAEKLMDAREERLRLDLTRCFFYGLRVGIKLMEY